MAGHCVCLKDVFKAFFSVHPDGNESRLRSRRPPPVLTRSVSENLKPEAAKQINQHLELILASRAYLQEEMLSDPLEARTFGITAANVADILERRLQLVDFAVRRISDSSTAGGVNEVPLAALGLGKCDLWKGYIPLALLLHEKMLEAKEKRRHSRNAESAFVLGINAPPGSGKSTLVQVLLFLISIARKNGIGVGSAGDADSTELRAVQLSSDDLYMGRPAREAVKLATRLDPRSLDPHLYGIVSKLKSASKSDIVELPQFNKGKDDRELVGVSVRGPFDLVLYEGWRVGVPPGELHGSCFDYTELNKPIDFLLYLDADPQDVWKWKLQSSRRDHEREHSEPWTSVHESKLMTMWDQWMLPFLQQHEQALAKKKPCDGGADLVLTKDSAHHILKVDLREQLKEYYDKNFATSPTRSAAASVLSKAFGRADLAMPLLQRSLSKAGSPGTAEGDPVSCEAFVDVAERLLQAPGEWSDLVWHRLVMSSSPRRQRTPETAKFACASVVISDGPGGAEAACSRLAQELGSAPSLVLVQAPTARGVEAAVDALSAKDSPCAGAVVHGCTTCLGVLADGEYSSAPGGALFGIADPAGCCVSAASAVPQALQNDASAWKSVAAATARDAWQSAIAEEPLVQRDLRDALKAPLVLLHATPGYEEAVLEGISSVLPGAHVFGGSAGDSIFNATEWRVASGSKAFLAPAIAITLIWPSVPYSLSLNCLHQPTKSTDSKMAVVTSADSDSRRILQLDGRPAAEVYNHWIDEAMTLGKDGSGSESFSLLKSAGPDSLTTLNPLARAVVDESDRTHFFPLHPKPPTASDGSLELFAAPRTGEKLVLLRGTRKGLVEAAGSAAAGMRDDAANTSGQGVAGAVVIYCAGCALELERGSETPGALLSGLGSTLRTALALPGSEDQSGTPFLGGFTFGEQGPLLPANANCHANLMFNVLVFGKS